ncbi:hypothetical protein MPPM_0786 [Methylorubrum populi]|uniref:Uncharacterized protein n=1 Tax=Methylorubrum populi TaxID=223967 RepID=A0A160PD39_9HYPH|nr:hypothetical protein MPPM_0786 [Methylorubrum populi]
MRLSPARGAWSEIADMESGVKDVERYGLILQHLAESPFALEGSELHLVADLLKAHGQKLAQQWNAALAVAVRCEGRSCD